jgi:excisionase family DNA binding protein
VTPPRLPINPASASPRRRGGVRGTCGASGSPPAEEANTAGLTFAPLLIESREVARLLGIGRTKTFQMLASGQLPTVRIGRCVRVPVTALQEWIRRQLRAGDLVDQHLLIGSLGPHQRDL